MNKANCDNMEEATTGEVAEESKRAEEEAQEDEEEGERVGKTIADKSEKAEEAQEEEDGLWAEDTSDKIPMNGGEKLFTEQKNIFDNIDDLKTLDELLDCGE